MYENVANEVAFVIFLHHIINNGIFHDHSTRCLVLDNGSTTTLSTPERAAVSQSVLMIIVWIVVGGRIRLW